MAEGVPMICGNNEQLTAYNFSYKYLGKNVKNLVYSEGATVRCRVDIDDIIEKISPIFKDITTIRGEGLETEEVRNYLNVVESENGRNVVRNIGGTISDIIEESAARPKEEERLLLIKSPLGSYKNRLLGYIYLKVASTDLNKKFLPFYIDLAHYESDRSYEQDLENLKSIAAGAKDLTPFFIIDNVKTFPCEINELYRKIYHAISGTGVPYKLIVGADYRFKDTVESKNKSGGKFSEYEEHPTELVNEKVSRYSIRIAPMRLEEEAKSKIFIRNCIEFFGSETEDLKNADIDENKVYERLVSLELMYIDAYWLVKLLKEEDITSDENPKKNLADIYNDILVKMLPTTGDMSVAAELAYNFDLTGEFIPVKKTDGTTDKKRTSEIWTVIRKHKSVLDYLIAKHYVRLLGKADPDKPADALKSELKFFNRIFPKNITRFAAKMIEGNEDLERIVFRLSADDIYDNDDIFGISAKSELTYWLGRLSAGAQDKAFATLKMLKDKSVKSYHKAKGSDGEKSEAFLLRGIYVSLLYFGGAKYAKERVKMLNEYLRLLLTDKTSNEVNRAFHLEYYNDIKYASRPGSDDFIKQMADNVQTGKNTFRKLSLNLEKKEGNECVKLLQLVTLCNLILARKPEKIDAETDADGMRKGSGKVYYVKHIDDGFGGRKASAGDYDRIYNIGQDLDKCIGFVRNAEKYGCYDELDNLVKKYFKWVLDELEWLRAELDTAEKSEKEYFISYIETRTYNRFNKIAVVPRTGWVQRGVRNEESVAEHIYNCWLMALLFLPKTGTAEETENGYDKTDILNMLLIHDLGEVVIGDIPRNVKTRDSEVLKNFNEQENDAMYSFLLTSTYPFVNSTMSDYFDTWDAWASCDVKKDINSEIAKDIDNIQAVHRYCRYYPETDKNLQGDRKISVYNGDNKIVLEDIDSVRPDEADCFKWLATVDPDGGVNGCILKSERGREISRKVIFENPEFTRLIGVYEKNKKTNG